MRPSETVASSARDPRQVQTVPMREMSGTGERERAGCARDGAAAAHGSAARERVALRLHEESGPRSALNRRTTRTAESVHNST
jgi:hypothetical protein